MKDLTELGRYLELLIQGSHEGNFSAAARDLEISGAELHALRHGQRQSPNPEILKRISEKLNGDYYILFELAGYSPPIREELPVVKLPLIKGAPPAAVGEIECPISWLRSRNEAKGYFWIDVGDRIALIRIIDAWENGEVLLTKDGMFRAYRIDDKIELLSMSCPPTRQIVDTVDFKGIVEKVVMDFGKEG